MTSLLLILILLTGGIAHGADRHVLASATGANNGLTWTDAYTTLPASLSRTNIYYIGNGSYGDYTFNDATDGTNYVTIRKATIAAHGSETGWDNAYAAQATFGTFGMVTDYQMIDGATRDETNWRSNVYGFRVTGGINWNQDWYFGGWISDHVTIQYVDFGGTASESVNALDPDNGLYFTSYPTNHIANDITISRCHFHNYGGLAMSLKANDGMVIEYCHIGPTWGKEAIRGGTTAKNITIRHNVFLNASQRVEGETGDGRVSSTGQVAIWDAEDDLSTGDFDGCEIYGNIFAATTDMVATTDAIILVGSDQAGGLPTADNVKVYNNTIVGFQGGLASGIKLVVGAANEARNNIYYDVEITPVITAAIQSFNSNYVSSPFIDYAAGDYRLTAPTISGTTLTSPYDTDITGASRTNWSLGALEYGSTFGAIYDPAPETQTQPILNVGNFYIR